MLLVSQQAIVLAQTNIYKTLQTPLYDPNSICSNSPASPAEDSPESGLTAAQALEKQTTLDARWRNLILKFANKHGADPLAMASILYWENRGFPEYKTSGWPSNPSVGMGPWQFTQGTWEGYMSRLNASLADVQNPVVSTEAAAIYIKGSGGTAGATGGSIEQDFGEGKNIPSMATVVKTYNAGGATYRAPGVAKHLEPGRIWNAGSAGDWANRDSRKPKIIDDYIVAATYIYYQVATGQTVTYKDSDAYVSEALTKQDQIKNFSFGGEIGTFSEADCTITACSTEGVNITGAIVLDPGHSPTIDPDSQDAITGLYNADYPNPPPEMQDAYGVAVKIRQNLTARGYKAILTKSSADEKINLSERAKRANDANASLLFTIHGDANARFLAYPDENSKRTPKDSPRKDGKDGLVDPSIIGPSREMANKLAPLIAQKTGVSEYKATSFQAYYKDNGLGGNGKNNGNTPVQTILSKVPSVYSEFNVNALDDKFATAVSDAIAEVMGDKGKLSGGASDKCAGAVGGSIVQTAVNLSWPDNRGPTLKPEYRAALAKYNPGTSAGCSNNAPWGVDCGVFVSTVMRASGADPNYPVSGTWKQADYVRQNKDKYDVVESVSAVGDLQPGDILIVNQGGGAGASGHTIIYVGKQTNGFDAASASWCSRGANLGKVVLQDHRGKYMRARLK